MLTLIAACVFSLLSGSVSPDIGDLQVFPKNNPWNWDISVYAIHANSDNFIDIIGRETILTLVCR